MIRNLIVDLSNIIWMIYFADKTKHKKNKQFLKEYLFQETVKHITSATQKHACAGVLIACDSPHVWRKEYYPLYKANRIEEKKIDFEEVMGAIEDMKFFFNNHTNIPAIYVDSAEADDIVAIASWMTKKNSLILSGDKDFIQLIGPTTRLHSPSLKRDRKSDNPAFDLFVKCIRGDHGDNVESAFPRVREVRLKKAWEDDIEMMNLMETILPDGRKVADLYQRNKRLIDLKEIPDWLVENIKQTIKTRLKEPHHYNYLDVMQYLSKNNLKEFAKDVSTISKTFKKTFLL
jgi:5'-3' exonuclease